MSGIRGRTRAAMLFRSLAVQASWNYRTLIGGGLAFALLPALRRIFRDQPERLDDAVRRHCEVFNSHPYLTPMALGALAVLEAEGVDAALIQRFKTALRGSLGSLGDSLIWVSWRSTCALVALAALVLGAAWWIVVLAFLIPYNAGHLGLRIWALGVGLREGKNVGQRLRGSPVREIGRRVAGAGALAAGVVLPFAVAGEWPGADVPRPYILLAAAAAFAGVWLGSRIRAPAALLLAATALLGWVLGGIE